VERRSPGWWGTLAVTAALPAATYFPLTSVGSAFRANPVFPQGISNQILVWALGTGALALVVPRIVRLLRAGALREDGRDRWSVPVVETAMVKIIVAAVLSVTVLFAAVWISDAAFTTDLRFWVVALRLPAPHHWRAFSAYLVPFTGFFFVSQRTFQASLSLRGGSAASDYGAAMFAAAGGMLALTLALYTGLFINGHLPVADALFSIIAIQFVPVLAATGVISAFTWRRTNRAWPGALMCGLLVTWYVVAGQATHVVS
jgi:hypothetical protein